MRGRILGIDHEPEPILPPARRAQGIELVLPEDMGGEPIGIRSGPSFRICEDVDFSVRLLKRLNHLPAVEPVAPGEDIVHRVANRVPERYGGIVLRSNWLAIRADHAVAVPDAGRRFPFRSECPDEAASD